MSGPGFCGLGAEGRGGERAGDWPAARGALPPREVQNSLLLVPAGLGRAAWDPSQADLEMPQLFPRLPCFYGVKTPSGS